MKKMTAFLIFVLLMCMTVSANAASVGVDAVYDNTTQNLTLTVSGVLQGDAISILVSQYDAETLNDYTDLTEETISNHVVYSIDTVFDSSVIQLPLDNPQKGYYAAYVGAFGKEPGKAVFYVALEQDYQAACNAFGAATVQTLPAVISQYCINEPVISLELTNPVYVANSADVHRMMLTELLLEETVSVSSITQSFDKAMMLATFNTAADKPAVLEAYRQYLTLTDLEVYQSSPAAVCALISLQSDAVDGKVSSVATFHRAYQKAIALTKLNNASRDDVRACLTENAALFGINAVDGYTRANASQVNIAMAFQNFQTTEAVAAAFQTAVVNHPLSVVPPIVGGGGGGGFVGAGGNGGKTPLNTAVTTPANPLNANGFSDIAAYPWASDAIKALQQKGILSGNGSGAFEPARAVTREEFAKIMVEGFDIVKNNSDNVFSDVAETAWYKPYVLAAREATIITGMGDGNFGVGKALTREDACVILYRYLKGTGFSFSDKREASAFSDAHGISEYASEAVEKLYVCGIVNGRDNNQFHPKTGITRAEIAVLVYNVLTERGMLQ